MANNLLRFNLVTTAICFVNHLVDKDEKSNVTAEYDDSGDECYL